MIICITGLAGSGKTTVAKEIMQYFQLQNKQIIQINSDSVAEKVLIHTYGHMQNRNTDYKKSELNIIYAGMFEIIDTILEINKDTIILTDGMYRKSSQKLLLKIIAEQKQVPFFLVKVVTTPTIAKRRLNKRFKEEGLGGWVDPNVVEDIDLERTIVIENDSTINDLKTKIHKALEIIDVQYAYFSS